MLYVFFFIDLVKDRSERKRVYTWTALRQGLYLLLNNIFLTTCYIYFNKFLFP